MKTFRELLEGLIPSTEDRGRHAVVNAPAKIKRAGGYSADGKHFLGGREVGHDAHGRSYLDPDLFKKHGWARLSNAHMDM